MAQQLLHAGIDIGSTTTKVVVLDPHTKRVLYRDYQRHHASQAASVCRVLQTLAQRWPGAAFRLALTGSGAKLLAGRLGVPYIQEVVANSLALQAQYDTVGTAIELGGQDAKILFFHRNETTGSLDVADMRMNGSCAGGTGAFVDEMASVLNTPVEQFNALAARGRQVYDISGRCGVYAKTDIQPLLNQGVEKADLALSALHAIAKQTIGGLAQGLDILPPVAFEGGPLTFNPTLVRVFQERLGLADGEVLLPPHPETIVAHGAALALSGLFAAQPATVEPAAAIAALQAQPAAGQGSGEGETAPARPFFASKAEQEAWQAAHALRTLQPPVLTAGATVRAWLGIDSGSTTKFVLLGDEGELLESFYAPNRGEPLTVAKNALLAVRDRYRAAGVTLEILGAGTTGYGELMFAKAFSAECHVVETVAHARAAAHYVPDASFILDIGGQDMKAIWVDNGVITNIVVNEACSSGCGSFLENFASSLHISAAQIAGQAFASQSPAALGSRCTVFMNSSIVTEQRNGKQPCDIMAGLCRSIIENVFTKVIRISNLSSLGDKIVVQGGTFRNDAVLCALEQYIGKPVTRAPYPEIMGAIGAALLTKERAAGKPRSFIGLDALEHFAYTQTANDPCPFCGNHCKRTVITFSNGESLVTNNRCERGEVLGDPTNEAVRARVRQKMKEKEQVPDLFKLREKLLFQDWPVQPLCPDRAVTIGIPRVLSFWDYAPFWSTLLRSLGFRVRFSPNSSRAIYESGLQAVTSDTVCFPAKLVHGHIRSLLRPKVDRIFMPSVSTVPPENEEKTSESMCAVVKGYPLVVKNSDDPTARWGIPYDAPIFHWFSDADREKQVVAWLGQTFAIPAHTARAAVRQADQAQASFRSQMLDAGRQVLEQVERTGGYAVVMASRPYQNDPLVNHGLPGMFTALGIPVLTADALPPAPAADLDKCMIDVVNNYHARMLSSAIHAARSPHLEYVQLVSFGCGHDAYLSDEIQRMMKQISGKAPLILKLDESDVQGPLRIRVRSFVDTLNAKRQTAAAAPVRPLPDPYPVKFTKQDKEKIVLVPNTSHAFCRVLSACFKAQGLRTVPLEYGREEAIRLGKQYVHNDICFPAQIVIGEALAALRSGKYDDKNVAVAMAKYVGDCRLTHYAPLLRKALDDAGYAHVPILTNDDKDSHDQHPGFTMNLASSVKIACSLPMIDVLEELLRKIRPYELVPGSADAAFEAGMDALIEGLETHGVAGARKGFARAIDLMKAVQYDRSHPRPTVLIVGEYLLNFHPGANHDVELYLEHNGLEVIEARMTDVIRKIYFVKDRQWKELQVTSKPLGERGFNALANQLFEWAHDLTDAIAKAHPLYTPAKRLPQLVQASDPIIHHTFDAGEGVLIPGEILHHAANGCRAFLILQPFGCLPNHVVGRGITKKLKELYPDAQILPLDYDPDVSFANVENRLQMLIMNVKQAAAGAPGGAAQPAAAADGGENGAAAALDEADRHEPVCTD